MFLKSPNPSYTRTVPAKRQARIILSMRARYIGCCPCGALIDAGDLIKYDTHSHRAYCFDCGAKRVEEANLGIEPAEEDGFDESQEPEALRSLKEMITFDQPFTLEFRDNRNALLETLEESYANNPVVRKYVLSLAECRYSETDGDFVAIAAKYPGKCTHCERPIKPGRLALYDRNSKNMHCLLCDCT